MPAARCKLYWGNGTPFIPGGCDKHNCPFIHPNEARWASLPPYKSKVRCKFFDSQGKPVALCQHGSRDCRYIHPDDPSWALAGSELPPPHELPRPLLRIQESRKFRGSEDAESPASTSASNPGRAEPSTASSKSVPPRLGSSSLPRLQTDVPKTTLRNQDSPSMSLDSFFPDKHINTPTSATVADPRLVLRRAASSTPARIATPDSMNSSSAPSQIGGPKRQAWKNLILSLTQAVKIRQEIQEADRRTSLFSLDDILALKPLDKPQLEDVLGAWKGSKQVSGDRINPIVTQLMEADFWPFSTAVEMESRLERLRQGPHKRLAGQIDELEGQLREYNKMRTSTGQGTETVETGVDNTDMDESRERQLSPNRTSDFSRVMDRLNIAEQTISEMEEGEIWRHDQIAEKIENLFAKIPLEGDSFPAARSNLQATFVEFSANPVEARLQTLNNDFAGICEALAEHWPAVATLEAEVGKLRLGVADTRHSMNSLESLYENLQERLDSLSRQTLEISSQTVNRQIVPDTQLSINEGREYLVRSTGQDILQHITTEANDLTTHLVSRYKDAQREVLVNFESTIIKTGAIYDVMKRHSEEKRLRINGATDE